MTPRLIFLPALKVDPRRPGGNCRQARMLYAWWRSAESGVILSGMKLAILPLLTIALVAGPIPQTQNRNLIGPGDVLVVKLQLASDSDSPVPVKVKQWRNMYFPIVKTVAVTPDGKLRLPVLQGLLPSEDLSVGGLGLVEAAQRLEQSYIDTFKGKFNARPFHVVIERGTVDQFLRQ
jgi:hypothetical protein